MENIEQMIYPHRQVHRVKCRLARQEGAYRTLHRKHDRNR